MNEKGPSVAELLELESVVVEALKTRDDTALCVLGAGEVSVALGWPIDAPSFVCKRTPPFTSAQYATYERLVTEYIQELRDAGLNVVDTSIVPIGRDPKAVSYLVQPLLDSASLGHNVLRSSEPDPEHAFLVALANSLEVVTPHLSFDAQVTNFSWDGETLTLVDVGTPFLWDDDGAFRLDMTAFAQMLPAPMRRIAVKELTKLVVRWNDPRRVGLDVVANLYREGLPEWVDPTVEAFNRHFGASNAVTTEEAREFYEEDAKLWPALKKAQALERWWRTTVRRQPYDWFIYSSFD